MRKTSASRAKGENRLKIKLGIPDLEHSKAAVLRSLGRGANISMLSMSLSPRTVLNYDRPSTRQ
jgi:hypothetical protein